MICISVNVTSTFIPRTLATTIKAKFAGIKGSFGRKQLEEITLTKLDNLAQSVYYEVKKKMKQSCY